MPDFLNLQGYGTLLVDGAKLTIVVGLSSMVIAILLGLVGAWGKLARSRLANTAAGAYTTIVRGVPELVMILLVYYGAPTLFQDIAALMEVELYVDLNPLVAGMCTIGFIYGAFSTEVFRGAFLAVDKGQVEAARSVGMGRVLCFRRILLPQMWRFALPGLGNVWMVLIKATALISVIQLPELMRNSDIAARATRLPFTCYFLASLFYLAITVFSLVGQRQLERWANKGVRKV